MFDRVFYICEIDSKIRVIIQQTTRTLGLCSGYNALLPGEMSILDMNSNPFYLIARKLWPELATMSSQNQLVGTGDVLIFLVNLPLAAAGIIWLYFSTSLSVIVDYWKAFLFLAGLMVIFQQLNYFIIFEIRKDRYGSADGSLAGVIQWAAIFLLGPTALWLSVIGQLARFSLAWRQTSSKAAHWSSLRNFTVELAVTTVGSLVALIFYQKWIGVYPFPEMTTATVLAGLATLSIYILMVLLIWSVYIAYSAWVQNKLAQQAGVAPLFRFMLLALGFPFLALPFAILLAGLYVQNGFSLFLFLIFGLLLVAILARRLSWAVENSRQKSRQLEQLEQLGREILSSPPDGSKFPDILSEHVPTMFPSGRVAVWLSDGTFLHKHPEDWEIEMESIWQWVSQQKTASAFLSKENLPWRQSQRDHNPIVLTPVIDLADFSPVGCVFIELRSLAQPWDRDTLTSLFPAVHSLADQVASTLHRSQVYQETLEYQAAMQELEFAGRIQAGFLPSEVPILAGWELAVTLLPARMTSGDYFDFISLGEGRIGILIADVADKGLGAALYMAISRTLIRTYALEYDTQPDLVCFSANERILQDARTNLFVTCFYGILDQSTGLLTYCNAGHNPPFLISSRDDGSVQPLTATGMPIGVDEEAYWSTATVQIEPGDVLLLYTDGIPEAQNGESQFFKEWRMLDVAHSKMDSSAHEIQGSILEALTTFVGDAPQFDDITLLVVMRERE